VSTYTRLLHTAKGSETLLSASLVVQTAWSLDASNYYTITLRHRRSGQTYGELVGSAYSLADRNLSADTPVTIYSDAQGIELIDGEKLVAYVATTGSPTALEDPKIVLDLQRNTR